MNAIQSASIVLVEPRQAMNVGAAARAMKNMGFTSLRLVCPSGDSEHLSEPARRMASGSEEILEEAQVFRSLEEALADLHVAAGCTARHGKGRRPVLHPRELRRRLIGYPGSARFGIVFGREDRGLLNEELDLCQLVVTVPTAPDHPSLNLAQAGLVVCYELRGGAVDGDLAANAPPRSTPATIAELERLYRHARDVLVRIGFLDRNNPDRILRVLRRLLGRAGPDSREVTILRGILRQMDWYAGRADERSNDSREP